MAPTACSDNLLANLLQSSEGPAYNEKTIVVEVCFIKNEEGRPLFCKYSLVREREIHLSV